MKHLRSIAFASFLFSTAAHGASHGPSAAEWESLLAEGNIEYTAVFIEREGEPFAEIRPVNEAAYMVDEFASQGIKAAWSETASFVEGLKESAEARETEIENISLNLVFQTLNVAEQHPELDWVKEGLTIGFADQQKELQSVSAARDWFGGKIFVGPSNLTPVGTAKLANYRDETVAGLSVARMREVAQQAANEMFSQAAEAGCNSKPRPQQISPSVSVSFNLFAGAEFSISATYVVAELCRGHCQKNFA